MKNVVAAYNQNNKNQHPITIQHVLSLPNHDTRRTCSYAVNMVGKATVLAAIKIADVMFHELPESVLRKEVIFLVERLVFLHISFVFEGESTIATSTVEVRRALHVEGTGAVCAVFSRPETLEALLLDDGSLAMVVRMHLHIGSADVNLVTARLQT